MKIVEQNHYEFLGVEPDAPADEIRRAVSKLREMFAPDALALYSLVDREEHKALLDRLEEAAVVLADERARLAYDERHGLGRRAPEPIRSKARPGPSAQLELSAIVDAVDGAPAWPGRAVGVAEAVGRARARPERAARAVEEADEAQARPGLAAGAVEAVDGAPAGEAVVAEAVADEPPSAVVAAPFPAEPGVSAPTAPASEKAPAGEVAREAVIVPAAVAEPGDIESGLEVDVELELDAEETKPATATAQAFVPEPPVYLPPMPELGPGTEYSGDLLRQIREARGVTLRELATRTRISVGHLEHLEADAFRALPERVYLRGILVAYARELKIDGTRIAETYLARWAAGRRG